MRTTQVLRRRNRLGRGAWHLYLQPDGSAPGGPGDGLEGGGAERLDGADEVFRQLVTARLIEPTSKQDSLRVLTEAGLSPVSYATVKRHLPSYATADFTRDLSRPLAGYARIGRASLVLFDVTTLYFETDKADGLA